MMVYDYYRTNLQFKKHFKFKKLPKGIKTINSNNVYFVVSYL